MPGSGPCGRPRMLPGGVLVLPGAVGRLASTLGLVARLIGARMGSRVLYVTQGGYEFPTCDMCGHETDEGGHTIWSRAPNGDPHLLVIQLEPRAPDYVSLPAEDPDDPVPVEVGDPEPVPPRMWTGDEYFGPRPERNEA